MTTSITVEKNCWSGSAYDFNMTEVGPFGFTVNIPKKISWSGFTSDYELIDAIADDETIPDPGDAWPGSGSKTSGMVVVQRTFKPMSHQWGYVTCTYAMPTEPLVDSGWAVSYRGMTQVQDRGYYYSEKTSGSEKPIVVKFKPRGLTVEEWSSGEQNQRRYQRGMGVPTHIGVSAISLRQRVSHGIFVSKKMTTWIRKYVGKLNSSNNPRCYLMTDLQITPVYYTAPDTNAVHTSPIWDVRAELAYAEEGWDPYVFYLDGATNCRYGGTIIHDSLKGGGHTVYEVGNPTTGGATPDTAQDGWGLARPWMYVEEDFGDEDLAIPDSVLLDPV
jgi:hypothetical protein